MNAKLLLLLSVCIVLSTAGCRGVAPDVPLPTFTPVPEPEAGSSGTASEPTPSATSIPTPVPGRADPVATARAYLERIVPFGFSGAVLIEQDGAVVLEEGYGAADHQRGVPATADTVFSTGSLTKQFTAAAILKLEMHGLLSVTDPITAYLENVPPDKEPITIHHLLTHSSGLAPFGNFFGDYAAWDTREEALDRFLREPLLFEPGSDYAYSNAGYSVLAAIIEVVSGQSYEAYLRDNLFLPAGMTQTGYRLPDWQHSQLAHFPEAPRGFNPEGYDTPLDVPFPFWLDIGNGEILSTVGDLYRWKKALTANTILDEAATQKLFQPHVNENLPGVESYYGYGWVITSSPTGGRHIWHNGGSTSGTSAEFHWFPDDEALIVVLSNGLLDGPVDGAAALVYRRLEELFFEGTLAMPPAGDATTAVAELAGALGSYETEEGARFTISVMEDGAPVAEARNAAAFALLLGNVGSGAETEGNGLSAMRIRALAEGLAQGQVDAYLDLLPPGAPISEERRFWPQWAAENNDRLGGFEGTAYLGTSGDYGPFTRHFVAVGYARGYQFVVCIPLGTENLFCMSDDAVLIPRERALLVQSPEELVTFSPLFQETVLMSVQKSGTGGAPRLVVNVNGREVVAERVD